MPWKRVDAEKVHRLFYPQVPVIVTAQLNERIGAMPAIWCIPLSFKPALVGVAVAPEHETYRLIIGAEAFGVNWLSFNYAEKVARLGETSSKSFQNKLSSVGLTAITGRKTPQPLIQEASAILECELSERYKTGSHELLVGRVVEASANEHFKDYWDFSRYDPLLYAGTINSKGKSWVFKSLRGSTLKSAFKYTNAT